MPRRMHHLHAQATDEKHIAVVQAHVHEWRRTLAMHHDGYPKLPRELACGRKVVGVRVRINQVMNAQTVARRNAEVAIDLTDLRINHDCRARVAAAEQIGLATAVAICSKIIVSAAVPNLI